MLRSVRFLEAGYCTQLGYLAGRPAPGPTRFPAVFVYLEHPDHGPALIDAGYGPHFFAATASFPERLYRWVTPARLAPEGDPGGVLAARGLDPAAVRRVFVSHYHGDHIGGLRRFDRAEFVHRPAPLDALLAESRFRRVKHGFLAGLLPDDFRARGRPVPEDAFTPGGGALAGFRTLDFWGDGSLVLVDLPGHAAGHTGYLLATEAGPVFYVVDATWDVAALLAGRPLPWISRRFQADWPAYAATQERLRDLAARGGPELLACHCPRTQAHPLHA